MKQWDIYLYPFGKEGAHPAVIVSNDERCESEDLECVNALICASARLNRAPKKHEVILDEADGLNWKTAVRCDLFYLLPKAEFTEMRGRVSDKRKNVIARKIVECLRLPVGF